MSYPSAAGTRWATALGMADQFQSAPRASAPRLEYLGHHTVDAGIGDLAVVGMA